MNRHLFVILSFVFVITIDNCCAQDTKQGYFKSSESKKSNPAKTQQKATVSKQPEKTKAETLNVTTNEDCSIKIGEVNYGNLIRGDKRSIVLAKGTYTLTATSTQGAYLYVTELSIADSAVSVQIDLTKVINTAKIKSDSVAKAREKVVAASEPPPVKKISPEMEQKAKLNAKAKTAIDALLSEMITIEAGSFTMGNNLGDNDEGPEHMVSIRGFKFCKYEVTQQQWEAVMGTNPSLNHGCATCPVENITIADIDSFIIKVSSISSRIFRLPSEAEWEYVAKKGGVFKDLADRAWYNNNSGKVTQPVGTKGSNALGIFDMAGNVAEWCSDWYSSGYYKKKVTDNPKGPETGEKKVVRGGAYNDSENTLRPSHRDKQNSDIQKQTVGLRLVMDKE